MTLDAFLAWLDHAVEEYKADARKTVADAEMPWREWLDDFRMTMTPPPPE